MPDRERPTVASLQERIKEIDAELGRRSSTAARERYEAGRTRRGATRANRRAEQAHVRIDDVERRTGVLETASSAVLERLSIFSAMFRSQREDSARHEERITHLESRNDNIAGAWLATLLTVEAFVLLAWLVMAGWHNGLNQRLEDTPSYDSLFLWLAIGSAIVISVVAIAIWALRDQQVTSTRVRTSGATQTERHEQTAVAVQSVERRGSPPAGNADDTTQVMPEVRS